MQITMDLVKRIDSFNLSPDAVLQRAEVMRQLALLPGERIVDLGCGLGHLCQSMADLVGKTGSVTGVDISPEIVDAASQRNHCSWLSYECCDIMASHGLGKTFDIATCVQVLEYLPQVDTAIKNVFDSLKPSGRALFVATDWDGVIWHSDVPSTMASIMNAWRTHCLHPGLPRTMAPRAREAGFVLDEVSALPILNLEFHDGTYSHGLAEVIGEFVLSRGLISVDEYERWIHDLESLYADGRYFFYSSRFLFRVSKPQGGA